MSLKVEIAPAFLDLYDLAYTNNMRHFFMWGGRGGGKSQAMDDFLAVHGRNDKGLYLCTREIQKSISDSVYHGIKQSIERIGIPGYYMTETSIEHVHGSKMVFAGLGYKDGVNIKSMSKINRAWVEEAQQLRRESIDVLVPTVRNKGSKLYYTFNRTAPRDPIYEFFLTFNTRREKKRAKLPNGQVVYWYLHRGNQVIGIEINHDGNPYFPEALELDRKRDEEHAKTTENWGHYNHVWRGMPQVQSEQSIITLQQAMKAAKRKADDDGAIEIGADIARGGKDKVVFIKRKGLRTIAVKTYANNSDAEKMRITETAERLMAFAGGDKECRIKVDDTGLGGGVTDILEDHGYNVVAVNFAGRAADYDHYTNISAELWYQFASIIDTVQIPDDTDLIEELVERREGRRDSRGRRTVEPKDDFKARVGRSPDLADALLLCYYIPDSIVSSFDWSIA